jgi:hypothetical protein
LLRNGRTIATESLRNRCGIADAKSPLKIQTRLLKSCDHSPALRLYRYANATQSLRKSNKIGIVAVESKSSRNHRTTHKRIAVQLLRNTCAIAVESPRRRDGIAAKTPRDRCGIAAQSLRNRRAIAAQSPRNRRAIEAQSLRNRSAIAAQLLRRRFGLATQSLCNAIATK